MISLRFSACMTTAFLVSLAMSLTGGQAQEECYKGLFVSEERLKMLKKASTGPVYFPPTFNTQLYNLSSYRREVTYPESCGVEVDQRSGSAYLTQCQTDPTPAPRSSVQSTRQLAGRSSGTCQPCCKTQMSFTVPVTVVDVGTGAPYTATHYDDSYQLLHTGHCVTQGAACGYQGRCEQVTRIEWVLVDVPAGNMFVPTSVPSHCTCIYT